MAEATAIEIRPITPEDKQALLLAFERLSEHSRYRRFLASQGGLSATQLRYFTEVDHHDHEALMAIDPETGEGVGVARFVRLPDRPHCAELAVAVIDDWQHRGVGTRLVAALAGRARDEGVTTFTAMLLAENEQMRGLLDDLGPVSVIRRARGTVEVNVELPVTAPMRLKRMLQRVARGELRALASAVGARDAPPHPPATPEAAASSDASSSNQTQKRSSPPTR